MLAKLNPFKILSSSKIMPFKVFPLQFEYKPYKLRKHIVNGMEKEEGAFSE